MKRVYTDEQKAAMRPRHPVPGYAEACARARRYRERGWRAAVSAETDAPRRWRVWDPGSGTPPQEVLARSCDCALAQGRRLQPGACAVQLMGGE